MLDLIERLGGSRVQAGVYDGDTPPVERTRIRESCNLILTNPDMLNSAYLPNHGRKGFSAHLPQRSSPRDRRDARLSRRLRFARRQPDAAFATHLRALRFGPAVPLQQCHHRQPDRARRAALREAFSLIDEDGSPSSGKTIHFWQPPIVENDFRRSVVQEMSELLPHLVDQRARTIAFCRSRKETEIVLKESRDALGSVDGGHDESALIAGYRGGYTPEERRQVERDLLSGRLVGVVSTNALELGIDIGGLEVVVQGGFPGTRASFWQQIGRRRAPRSQVRGLRHPAHVAARSVPGDRTRRHVRRDHGGAVPVRARRIRHGCLARVRRRRRAREDLPRPRRDRPRQDGHCDRARPTDRPGRRRAPQTPSP